LFALLYPNFPRSQLWSVLLYSRILKSQLWSALLYSGILKSQLYSALKKVEQSRVVEQSKANSADPRVGYYKYIHYYFTRQFNYNFITDKIFIFQKK
jgi:hypothetical protein